MILYLASNNAEKLREFSEAAGASGVTIESVPGIEELPECVEDGLTFEENARKKALHYSRLSGAFVFADDSGLCVEALDGAPGVRSARFAGGRATYSENNEKLRSEMRGVHNRAAHFVCSIAFAESERILTTVEGRADGVILDAPRGQGGFGYDPLFFFPPLGRTFAELDSRAKFEVSHRGHAFRKLLRFLADH